MNAIEELLKAFELVEEYNKTKPEVIKEYRLYHNLDGSIIGLWENGFPLGDNYIVLDDPDVFHRNNTQLLKVVDKKLKIIDPKQALKVQLQKSTSGQPVVAGIASIALTADEQYKDIEYYDKTNS